MAVPLLLLLDYVGGPGQTYSGWQLLSRVDVIAAIFCALAALLLVIQPEPRRAGLGAAAALMFVVFGLVLATPLELSSEGAVGFELGGYLSVVAAFVAAGAALFAAERAARD